MHDRGQLVTCPRPGFCRRPQQLRLPESDSFVLEDVRAVDIDALSARVVACLLAPFSFAFVLASSWDHVPCTVGLSR